MTLRLNGSTSGYSEIDAPAIAGDQVFTLPGTGGTLDRLNRAGNVLQVVNGTTSTQVTNNSNVFADTGLTATITPSSASSKILVLVNQAGCGKDTNNTYLRLALLRGSTTLADFERGGGSNGTASQNLIGACSISYLDSPATTSAITYKTQLSSALNNANVITQVYTGGATGAMSTITLMEIAA